MRKPTPLLFETEGRMYYRGVEVKSGDILLIEEQEWTMVGGGRSPSKNQTPFLWVKHPKFGTVIFAPELGFPVPHRSQKPPEKEFVPKLQYMHVWKEKSQEKTVLALRVAEAYEKAKKSAEMSALSN
jgi:hypothetical protein